MTNPINVKAKFICQSIQEVGDKDPTTHKPRTVSVNVHLTAVTSGSKENETWSKWTPSGELKMSITNPECFDAFEPGAYYYITLKKEEEEDQ